MTAPYQCCGNIPLILFDPSRMSVAQRLAAINYYYYCELNMKNISLLIIATIFLLICSSISQSNSFQTDEDDYEEGPNWNEEVNKLNYSYSHPELLDTVFIIDKDKFQLKYKYFSLMDSAINLPKSYIWDTSCKKLVVHNFAVQIDIKKNSKVILSKLLNNDFFIQEKKELSYNPDLKKYGTIYTFDFYRFENKLKEFIFNVGYSIPMTDNGIGFFLGIDTSGNMKIYDTLKNN